MQLKQDQFPWEDDGIHSTTFNYIEQYEGLPMKETTIRTSSGNLEEILATCQSFLYASGFRWPKNYVLQFAPTDNFPREILDDADTEVSVN